MRKTHPETNRLLAEFRLYSEAGRPEHSFGLELTLWENPTPLLKSFIVVQTILVLLLLKSLLQVESLEKDFKPNVTLEGDFNGGWGVSVRGI